ncbi:MAG: hypothetical protein AB7C89_07015, partial [Intestinibacillus sp.]
MLICPDTPLPRGIQLLAAAQNFAKTHQPRVQGLQLLMKRTFLRCCLKHSGNAAVSDDDAAGRAEREHRIV